MMKKITDRSSKKCLNPWFKFLAIFGVAALTLIIIFVVDKKHINFNSIKIFSFVKIFNREQSADYILIAASGATPKNRVAVQFESCQNFLVVRESTGDCESFSNNPASYNIDTIRDFIRQQNIEAVIAGTMDINTYQMLNSSDVKVFTGVTGTVEEALKKYKKRQLVSFSRHYNNRQQNPSLNNTGNPQSVRRAAF